MKPLVIYHANCSDGFGAAFAAWLKFGDEAEYLPMSYGEALPEQMYSPLNLELYILDFSFSKEQMATFFQYAKHVVWLDHHKTAFEMWCGEYTKGMTHDDRRPPHHICLDDNKSGALLAWEYFHPGQQVPMAVRMIDDRDRWQFKLNGTKEFSAALFSLQPWSFDQWVTLGCGDSYPNYDLVGQGEAILRAHDQNVQSVAKGGARKCQVVIGEPIGGHDEVPPDFYFDGLAANCPPHLTSDVGHDLATQSGTFGLCWCLSKEGMTAKCSLRSNAPYDVSVIAKAFGGGGHAQASGFEVPIETLLGWMK